MDGNVQYWLQKIIPAKLISDATYWEQCRGARFLCCLGKYVVLTLLHQAILVALNSYLLDMARSIFRLRLKFSPVLISFRTKNRINISLFDVHKCTTFDIFRLEHFIFWYFQNKCCTCIPSEDLPYLLNVPVALSALQVLQLFLNLSDQSLLLSFENGLHSG